MTDLKTVVRFAKEKHDGVSYGGDSNKGYFDYHICPVANNICNAKPDIVSKYGKYVYEVALRTAFLHDIIEDTKVKYEELRKLFGEDVANMVRILSKLKNEQYFTYIRRVIDANQIAALLVKQSDINVNISASEQYLSSIQIELSENYCDTFNKNDIQYAVRRLSKCMVARAYINEAIFNYKQLNVK